MVANPEVIHVAKKPVSRRNECPIIAIIGSYPCVALGQAPAIHMYGLATTRPSGLFRQSFATLPTVDERPTDLAVFEWLRCYPAAKQPQLLPSAAFSQLLITFSVGSVSPAWAFTRKRWPSGLGL